MVCLVEMMLTGLLVVVGAIQVSLGMEYCGYLLRWPDTYYYWGDIVGLFLGGTVSIAQAFMRVRVLAEARGGRRKRIS